MSRIQIKSSNIKSIGWEIDIKHPETGILEIEFNNKRVYTYASVSYEIFTNFFKAESKGKYFNENIKDKFKGLEMK